VLILGDFPVSRVAPCRVVLIDEGRETQEPISEQLGEDREEAKQVEGECV